MKKGFTLIELVVAIGILGLLSSFVVLQTRGFQAKARDNKRKIDLQNVQAALELYYASNRSYPTTVGVLGCAASGLPDNQLLCGEPSRYGGLCYADGCTPRPYIPGLAPNFISILPSDPTRGRASSFARVGGCTDADAGYIYISNGVDYKMLAACTIEAPPAIGDSFVDPRRSPPNQATYSAWAVYSPGARLW